MDDLKYHRTEISPFIHRVDVELKRAQRYQIFVSLLVYDIAFVNQLNQNESKKIQTDILSAVHDKIRAIDDVSLLDSSKIALLLPETNRQGAEIASRRISSVLKEILTEYKEEKVSEVISPEMASYPDAAGTRTIKDFLSDYLSDTYK